MRAPREHSESAQESGWGVARDGFRRSQTRLEGSGLDETPELVQRIL